jgi:hypothetical protein
MALPLTPRETSFLELNRKTLARVIADVKSPNNPGYDFRLDSSGDTVSTYIEMRCGIHPHGKPFR